MNIRLIFFFLIVLISQGCRKIQSGDNSVSSNQVNQIKISYKLSPPDGGDFFWKLLNHKDDYWQKAGNFNDLSRSINESEPARAWIRVIFKHSPASLNNTYFIFSGSGNLEFAVNGIASGSFKETSHEQINVSIPPRRPEDMGENIYSFYFENTRDDFHFALDMMNEDWICTDKGNVEASPVMNTMIRDAMICKGGDGNYYMTGTTGEEHFILPGDTYWLTNPGIQVFRSKDLRNWESLDYVWNFEEDGTWQKEFGTFGGRGPARAIFAPQIHYIKGKYWIAYSVNHTTDKHTFGIGLLWSDTPEGPYHEVSPEEPLTNGFDAHLFEDDDGKVYLLKHGYEIAPLTEDMSALAGDFQSLVPDNYVYVGYEGIFLFKHKGKYYLTSADWNVHEDGGISYDSMIATSDSLFGPYNDRYCAIRYGGHNGYFQGPDGNLLATAWCYPDGSNFWQYPSILKLDLDSSGRFYPVDNY